MADDRDDGVEVVERQGQAFEDVCPLLRLPEVVLGTPDHDLVAVVDVVPDRVLQRENPRPAVDERDHIHPERVLQARVLVDLVLDDIGDGVLLELDHDAHPVAVALVSKVGDALDAILANPLGNPFQLGRFVDLVRDFVDDERLPALPDLFNMHLGAHHHAAPARMVGLVDATVAVDDAPGRKVGGGKVLHQPVDRDLRVVDVGDRGVDRLPQVMRRDFRRHPHGDPVRTVDEHVGEGRRKHDRLFEGAVKVFARVDGLLVEVRQHLLGDLRHARLGIPHGRRRVAVDRAEVALAVDKGVPHREVLRQPHQRVVD